jgi:hypothetical protein
MMNLDPRLPSKDNEAGNSQHFNNATTSRQPETQETGHNDSFSLEIPQISLPTGGGDKKHR